MAHRKKLKSPAAAETERFLTENKKKGDAKEKAAKKKTASFLAEHKKRVSAKKKKKK